MTTTPQTAGAIKALFDAGQVAAAGVSRITILRDAAAGKIKARRFNKRRLRFTPTAVQEYLEGKQ
ncbi:MAG: hypothetical protein M0R74_20635 [Dehalococcoidia bacterium]|jgi:predicted site-specific integrase-resolvase|nr:hypothetical protein [Dehalococcoidia bacterium]